MHIINERTQSEKAVYCYDSKYMTCWKRQNYGKIKKICGFQGLGEGGEINYTKHR